MSESDHLGELFGLEFDADHEADSADITDARSASGLKLVEAVR